jgi:hypothetical protein
MRPLPRDVSDATLLAFIDQWAELLEREDYDAAFALTDHITEMGWSPALVREVIKSYGEAQGTQRVTVLGQRTDIVQRKLVDRWKPGRGGGVVGEIWYDLNIDGFASDLTATFRLFDTSEGISVQLNDIHVM